MALDTYAGLLAALARFSVRGDQTELWPDCVALAEAQFNRDLTDKAVRPMVAVTYADVDEEYEGVPADMIRPVSFMVYRDSERSDVLGRLDYVAPENFDQLKADRIAPSCESDEPAWYTVLGPEFRFHPIPTAARYGALTYVQKIPALADESPTNWLLSAHPDAYLYGALVQFAMTTEDERLGAWSQAYQAALAGVLRAYPTETNKAQLRTDFPLSRSFC